MATVEELRLPCLADTYLAAKAWGDAAAAARMVLCVHGSLDNAASFDGVGAALAAKGCYVIAVDLFGHGRSPPAPGGVYSNEVWALSVLDALESTRWDGEVVVIGHSMGTDICNVVAGVLATRRRGPKLTHVVMFDGSGVSSRWVSPRIQAQSPSQLMRRHMLLRRGVRRRGDAKKRYASLSAAVARRVQKNVGGQPIGRGTAAAIVERGARVDPATGECSFTHDVPQLMFSWGPAFAPAAESIDAYVRVLPAVLFVVAHAPETARPYYPGVWRGVVSRMQLCPRGRAVKVRGYHHWHADHGAEAAALILSFVAGDELPADDVEEAPGADPAQYDADAALRQIDADAAADPPRRRQPRARRRAAAAAKM